MSLHITGSCRALPQASHQRGRRSWRTPDPGSFRCVYNPRRNWYCQSFDGKYIVSRFDSSSGEKKHWTHNLYDTGAVLYQLSDIHQSSLIHTILGFCINEKRPIVIPRLVKKTQAKGNRNEQRTIFGTSCNALCHGNKKQLQDVRFFKVLRTT